MRVVLIVMIIAVLGLILIPGRDRGEELQPEGPAYTFAPEESSDRPAQTAAGDDSEMICVFRNGETVELRMRDYLIGTLAAEMPADFQPEALKAQAVAARTYAAYKAAQGSEKHPQAAVCGDAACCAAYQSPEGLAEKWGEEFYVNLKGIEDAVDATAGLYLTWEQAPILAVFHASSGERTESCGAVWGQELPYLVSVSSPEAADITESRVLVSWSEFLETAKAACPEAEFGENRADWLSVSGETESGRAARVLLGGVEMDAMDFRFLFGLRSTDFQFVCQEEGILFQVSGYGHGVGMSQQGAEAMAAAGKDFRAILSHYYPGTRLQTLAISDILG